MKSFALTAKSLALSLLLAGSALSASAFAADKVNINTADAATIDRVLVNIGPSKAEAIVAYRKANGAFRSAEQLALVKGVGLKTIEKNRDRIVVAGGAAPRKPAHGRTHRPRSARHPPNRLPPLNTLSAPQGCGRQGSSGHGRLDELSRHAGHGRVPPTAEGIAFGGTFSSRSQVCIARLRTGWSEIQACNRAAARG